MDSSNNWHTEMYYLVKNKSIIRDAKIVSQTQFDFWNVILYW